jgi:hypothetical protein
MTDDLLHQEIVDPYREYLNGTKSDVIIALPVSIAFICLDCWRRPKLVRV